jgi:hypothetical protein
MGAIVWLVQILTKIFLSVISWLEILPVGKIYPVNIDASQSILLYILIFSIYFMIRTRKWKLLFLSLICAAGIIFIDIYYCEKFQHEKKIIVYDIPYHSCIELVNNRKGIMLVKKVSENMKSTIQYHTGNHILKEKRKTVMVDYGEFAEKFPGYVKEGIVFFTWDGHSFAIIYGKCDPEILVSIPLDYLIITGNHLEMDTFLDLNLHAKQVIWDTSNSNHRSVHPLHEGTPDMHHVRIKGPYINALRD